MPIRHSPPALLLVATLLGCLLSQASAAILGEGCVCSDVRPRVGVGATHVERFAPDISCEQIRDEGKCGEPWLQDTVKELEGQGFCQITCGACICCAPVASTLRQMGLEPLLVAAQGTPWQKRFEDPAWMGAVLAPRAAPGPITDIEAHILPPVVEWGNATWTADLLAAEQGVVTAGGQRLPVQTSAGGTQVGRARMVQGDVQACKAVVHVVDTAVA